MDSEQLAKMFDFIGQQHAAIHGVVVIRHGYIVAEAYYYPLTREIKHQLASCTKSFTSALFGIALHEGHVKGLDQRVLDFFPERTPANPDPRKAAITFENLLTMSSGLQWPELTISYGMPGNPFDEMSGSADWVRFVLDRPLAAEPGQRWNYNSGGSHLLSAIVQKTTGMTLLAYGQAKLFGPLGIKDLAWPADPNGITIGSTGLQLRPRDMAKFGYLYLRGGAWDGKRVAPAEWVEASRRERFAAVIGDEGYGYQWWVQPFGSYAAEGSGGQYILIAPDPDLVVVFAADLPTRQRSFPLSLMQFFIMPAVRSSGPLAPNPAALARLQTLEREAEQGPAAARPGPLPATAAQIAGRTFSLGPNRLGWQGLRFAFGADAATIEVLSGGPPLSVQAGLDGRFRTVDAEEGATLAARGRWTDEQTLAVEAGTLGDAFDEYVFVLSGDGLTMTVTDRYGVETHVEGRLQ